MANEKSPDFGCLVCGGPLISERYKVVCRGQRCRYRIVFNCAKFQDSLASFVPSS